MQYWPQVRPKALQSPVLMCIIFTKTDIMMISRGHTAQAYTKIQQTKMLVTCQRFGNLFLFGQIWQYSSKHKTYNKGRFKVIAAYLRQ